MLTLAQLVTPQTPDQIKAGMLSRLTAAGFPVTDWLSGGVARTLVEVISAGLSDLTTLIAAIASGGFVDYASGDWLTLLADQLYELERNQATFTQGQVVLNDSARAGPFTIVAGELFFQSNGGLRFSNTAGGTLPKGSRLSLAIQGESPGSKYNVATASIRTMLTPLPGADFGLNQDPNSNFVNEGLFLDQTDGLAYLSPGALAGKSLRTLRDSTRSAGFPSATAGDCVSWPLPDLALFRGEVAVSPIAPNSALAR